MKRMILHEQQQLKLRLVPLPKLKLDKEHTLFAVLPFELKQRLKWKCQLHSKEHYSQKLDEHRQYNLRD